MNGRVATARAAIEEGAGTASRSPVPALLCNVLLAVFYLRFVWSHVSLVSSTGSWTLPPLVMQEALLVLLFLTRRRSIATSERLDDWALGTVGMLLPLLMRPTVPAGTLGMIGIPLQVMGLWLAVFGAACLGRSIGIVAADRGIRTRGVYAFVRHPMYAAYLVSYLGYVATYPSAQNILLTACATLAFHLRAVAEERFLSRDPTYREYLAAVRWRFIPAVY